MSALALRVLHLASFSGNIGDNANHMGFRSWFEPLLSIDVEWHELEIREFYWRQRAFDQSFVDLVNRHDLLVIGGGNYFELWVKESPTGTSIMIEPALFQQIHIPVLFNALGVDPGQGATDATVSKFRGFLDIILDREQYLVSVRNDGAIAAIREYVSVEHGDAVHRIPDGGFFAPLPRWEATERWPTLAINVANDMPDVRFSGFGAEGHGYVEFCDELAGALTNLLEAVPTLRVELVPHIYRDLGVIAQLVERIPDPLRRRRVSAAAYRLGRDGAAEVFPSYAKATLVLGNRFHANVCPLGMGVPTIGLANYRQIRELYKEINVPNGFIEVGAPGFAENLVERSGEVLRDPGGQRDRTEEVRLLVREERATFEKILRSWLAGWFPE